MTRRTLSLSDSRIGSMTTLCRGFTLVESAISVVLVSGLLVVALDLAGASVTGHVAAADRTRAMLLGQELMTEILSQAYKEPIDTPVFGTEGSEVTLTRSGFDDVDDYNTWAATPPQAKDGTPDATLVGWKRMVSVEWVDAHYLSLQVGAEQGVKRITVRVAKNNVVLASLTSFRTFGAGKAEGR